VQDTLLDVHVQFVNSLAARIDAGELAFFSLDR
jgi:hypothetical protein